MLNLKNIFTVEFVTRYFALIELTFNLIII